jgi:hypothetical protein
VLGSNDVTEIALSPFNVSHAQSSNTTDNGEEPSITIDDFVAPEKVKPFSNMFVTLPVISTCFVPPVTRQSFSRDPSRPHFIVTPLRLSRRDFKAFWLLRLITVRGQISIMVLFGSDNSDSKVGKSLTQKENSVNTSELSSTVFSQNLAVKGRQVPLAKVKPSVQLLLVTSLPIPKFSFVPNQIGRYINKNN